MSSWSRRSRGCTSRPGRRRSAGRGRRRAGGDAVSAAVADVLLDDDGAVSVRKIEPVGQASRQPASVQCLQTSELISQRKPSAPSWIGRPCSTSCCREASSTQESGADEPTPRTSTRCSTKATWRQRFAPRSIAADDDVIVRIERFLHDPDAIAILALAETLHARVLDVHAGGSHRDRHARRGYRDAVDDDVRGANRQLRFIRCMYRQNPRLAGRARAHPNVRPGDRRRRVIPVLEHELRVAGLRAQHQIQRRRRRRRPPGTLSVKVGVGDVGG